eukprot:CAMPEP_0119370238 /NCGR_PEP_ID=MMETSP1334-20130426/16633_1 /TAXON_ID=127549 /ORGANISM="Calcidiscus leptoporus, Strain RCC1130" /LENGTH=60 /DNA_ID=CAMNT_0007387263 /DNA_START=460 /DNA_END=639 /DNA_ORIENTATION=-
MTQPFGAATRTAVISSGEVTGVEGRSAHAATAGAGAACAAAVAQSEGRSARAATAGAGAA